jgi:hypothetical protein
MLANRGLNRCQAPGTAPGRIASKQGAQISARKQGPKSVPGTRCGARSDASKQGAQIGARHPVRRQGGMLAKREPKSVPGTRYGARPDASKQGPKSVPGTRYGAKHPVRRQEGC